MVEPSTTVPGRRTLVVVEDDQETRDLEVFLLGSEGYQVIGLPDGENAAEVIKREGADLVVLDLMLPRKDGIEVLGELGRDPATAHVPVLVISAYVDRPGVRARLRGCAQVKKIIVKPFDITDLLDAVSRELRSSM
jgi:two-component system alkaline phosphatase synthesis response regulator PhoP